MLPPVDLTSTPLPPFDSIALLPRFRVAESPRAVQETPSPPVEIMSLVTVTVPPPTILTPRPLVLLIRLTLTVFVPTLPNSKWMASPEVDDAVPVMSILAVPVVVLARTPALEPEMLPEEVITMLPPPVDSA